MRYDIVHVLKNMLANVVLTEDNKTRYNQTVLFTHTLLHENFQLLTKSYAWYS